jgi:hypothetical protein
MGILLLHGSWSEDSAREPGRESAFQIFDMN